MFKTPALEYPRLGGLPVLPTTSRSLILLSSQNLDSHPARTAHIMLRLAGSCCEEGLFADRMAFGGPLNASAGKTFCSNYCRAHSFIVLVFIAYTLPVLSSFGTGPGRVSSSREFRFHGACSDLCLYCVVLFACVGWSCVVLPTGWDGVLGTARSGKVC